MTNSRFDTRPVKVDQHGHQIGGGQFTQNELNRANTQQANRVLAHAVTGRQSSSAGRAQVAEFQAVPPFADVDVATGTIGTTKATVDASLALVNDALDAVIADANSLAAVLGIEAVVYAGGGTAASPIAAITDSGVALVTSAEAVNMDPIRVAINTNMHVAGALVNKILRATRHNTLLIETSPYRQPPPDDYGPGSTGANPPGSPADPIVSAAGSGTAFGNESPFTSPTPAIGEDSGAHVGVGITKTAFDAAFDTWRNNIETLAARLIVVTFDEAALTDSSGGIAIAGDQLNLVQLGFGPEAGPTGFINEADAGTTLTTVADVDASMVEVRNAIEELAVKAGAFAAGLGVGDFVYDGGGVGVDDTIAAIDAVITAFATGSQATEFNAWAVAVDQAFDGVAVLVNRSADAVGVKPVGRPIFAPGVTSSGSQEGNPVNADVPQVHPTSGVLDPFPGTIPVTGGSTADPGITKVAADAALVRVQDNVSTLAAKLNEIRTSLQAPLVRLV